MKAIFIFLSGTFFCAQSLVWASEKGITFQALLKDQSGAVISAPGGVPVRAQILSPNNCVLREELFASVVVSSGYLNLNLLNGVAQPSGLGGKDPGLTTEQVFDNSQSRSLVCVNSDGSVNGAVTSFNPATHGHARKLRLFIDLNSVVPGESLLVNFNIRSSAFAARADNADNATKLNSKLSTDFVNINSGSGVTQSNVESIFSNYAKLNSLLSANLDGSGNYTGNISGNAATATVAGNVSGTVSVANGGTGTTTLSANSVLVGNGTSPVQTVAPGASGNVLTSNGTTWVSSPASGAVTSVASKTGAVTLVAADITDFVTAADSRADTRIAAAKGIINGLASLDGSGKVPSSQLALSASDIPSLDAAKITTGTITNNVSATNVSATSVSGTSGQFTNLRVYDGSANYLTQKAPAGGFSASGYSIEWPAAAGSPSDVLRINAVAGSVATLEWAAPAGGGTVTSVGSGTGLTGGPITGSGTLAVDVGTTANKIVQLNGSAQLPAVDGSLLTNLPSPANFSGSLAGDVSGTQGSTSVDKIKGTAVSNTGLASGKYLKYDGTNWVPAIVGINDLVSSVTAGQQFTTSSCSASQTLNWSSLTDSFGCVSISITESNISGSIARSKLAAGSANRLLVNDGSGAMADAAGITASRALVSDANGIPVASTVTSAELAYLSGVTSAIQTQIDNKQASLGFTPLNKAGDTMTNALKMDPYGASAGNTSEVRFGELAANGANYVGFKSPDVLAGNKIWTLPSGDGSNGQVLKTDGTGVLSWASVGTGSVTSVGSGTGLTGGPITTTGTLSVDVGTSANKIVQLNGSAQLPAVDGSLLTGFTASQIPSLDWSKITTGKPTTLAGYGITDGGSITALTGDVTASGSGSVSATIASDAVTFSKMQNIATGKILGRSTASSGDIEEISIGSGLSLSAGTLSASGAADNLGNHTATQNLNLASYKLVGNGGSDGLVIDSGGNIGVGVGTPTAKVEVQGQIVAKEHIVATGGAVNFANGNVQILSAPGTASLTLSGMVNGAHYTLVIEETTSRTYSFSGCSTVRAAPALAATSGRSIFSILKLSTACYITWSDGF